jgi:hypothetical protein
MGAVENFRGAGSRSFALQQFFSKLLREYVSKKIDNFLVNLRALGLLSLSRICQTSSGLCDYNCVIAVRLTTSAHRI